MYSHFTFWASPQHILLHFPINLLHFPIKFASFPQKNASFPQQFAAFPQQNASFPQQFAAFPYAMLCHFANTLKPNFTRYSHFFYIFGIKFCLKFSGDSRIRVKPTIIFSPRRKTLQYEIYMWKIFHHNHSFEEAQILPQWCKAIFKRKRCFKNQLYQILIQEENLKNGGIVKSAENILPKPLLS